MIGHTPRGSAEAAVVVLRAGGVVVIPTDSCYGLAGDALREATVTRVLGIKGRGLDRPPAVFVTDLDAASHLVVFSERSRSMAARLLPGPRTLLLPARAEAPPWLVSPAGLIGIRWTLFAPVAQILALSGLMLTATSANITGCAPPYEFDALANALPMDRVDMVVEGDCGGRAPSEVIDLSADPPLIVRAGSGDVSLTTEGGRGHASRHRR